MAESDKRDYSDFLEYCHRVSEIVKTWPAWKQEVLGGKAVQQATQEQPKVIDATKRIIIFYYPAEDEGAKGRAEKNAARIQGAGTLVVSRPTTYTGPMVEAIDPPK